MYSLLVDNKTTFIKSFVHTASSSVSDSNNKKYLTDLPEPVINLSPEPDETTTLYELEDNNTLVTGSKYSVSQILNNLWLFSFDPKKGFRIKPSIVITRTDVTEPRREHLALVNEVVNLRISYVDPDGLDFFSDFDTVKFKDRQGLATIDTEFKLLDFKNNKYADVQVTSTFPGSSTLRAKDTMYLCQLGILQLRWVIQ